MALVEFADGFQDAGRVDLVGLKVLPDCMERGDGQFASQVLAELVESAKHPTLVVRIPGQEFGGKQAEAQVLELGVAAFCCRCNKRLHIVQRARFMESGMVGWRQTAGKPDASSKPMFPLSNAFNFCFTLAASSFEIAFLSAAIAHKT
jgi:hypothetical protein